MCEFCGCGMTKAGKHLFRRPEATEKPLAIRTVELSAVPKTPAVKKATAPPERGLGSRDPITQRG